MDWKGNLSNIFDFEETEKMGLRKGIVFYFNDWVDEKTISILEGIIEQFPLTSISIGVVVVEPHRFYNILEIGEVGAQVKHAAKSVVGSSYAIDKRIPK